MCHIHRCYSPSHLQLVLMVEACQNADSARSMRSRHIYTVNISSFLRSIPKHRKHPLKGKLTEGFGVSDLEQPWKIHTRKEYHAMQAQLYWHGANRFPSTAQARSQDAPPRAMPLVNWVYTCRLCFTIPYHSRKHELDITFQSCKPCGTLFRGSKQVLLGSAGP